MSKILKTYDSNKSEDWKSSMDRFGDDLTELILNYLPISDKIRLECTSKQNQSLIFNKQKCLRINDMLLNESYNHLNQLLFKTRLKQKQINCRAFETVLKKFKNFDTIIIEGYITIDSDLIQIITDNCKQLKTLWIDVRTVDERPVITDECLRSLVQKFGSSLKSFCFNSLPEIQMRQLLSSLPELRSVTVNNIRCVITDENIFEKCVQNSDKLPKLLPKLQEIEFNRCNENSLNQFQNEYSDNLLKISAKLTSTQLKSGSMSRALAVFGRFRRLLSLELTIVYLKPDIESVHNGFKQMGEHCLHLKKLSLILKGYLLEINWISVFSSFESLSSLKISLSDYNERNQTLVVPDYGSISDLRHLKYLKHLDISLGQMNDLFIENIDKYLPQLESIRFSTAKVISDKSLKYLSQMKFLSKLEIIYRKEFGNNLKITDSGVKQLIDSCPRITSLKLNQENPDYCFNLMEMSIKAMISKSERMPKIKHYFSFDMESDEKRSALTGILNSLPANMSVKIREVKSTAPKQTKISSTGFRVMKEMSKIPKFISKELEKEIKDINSSIVRFDEDLTEVILSYLPISDKLRLECTSKQVQRLIFNKQYCLRISDGSEETNNHLNQLLLKTSLKQKPVNCRAFETVLNKFKNLDTIMIEGNITVESDLIQMITHYCKQLKTLSINDRSVGERPVISNVCLISLVRKFGSSLKSLSFNSLTEIQMRQLVSSLPELRSVAVNNIRCVTTDENIYEECVRISDKLPKLLPKLQEIEFNRCDEKSLNQFQNEYSDNLLKISAKLTSKEFLNPEFVFKAFAEFGRFRRIQSLDLTIIFMSHSDPINALRSLTQLKHLSLTLIPLNDLFIENIDKYLPQLVSIRFDTGKAVTDKSLKYLSQLKYLLKLEIICFTAEEDNNITDLGLKQIIDGCPRIRSISLKQMNTRFDFNITQESIEAMISRSKRMAKIKHYFSCSINCVEKRRQLTDLLKSLPQNLSIDIRDVP